jgi:transcription antitermination factor NusG
VTNKEYPTTMLSCGWGGGNDVAQPGEYFAPQWYVAQTHSRHEKRVAQQLEGKGIEHFLPLYETVSRWKDRRVRLKLPLFAGYVFARFPLCERLRALEIPGVARLVGFGGTPVALPNRDLEAMRRGLSSSLRAAPHPYLTVGRRVRVVAGPFAGIEGILSQKKNNLRVVVSLVLIERSVAVDVAVSDIQPWAIRS